MHCYRLITVEPHVEDTYPSFVDSPPQWTLIPHVHDRTSWAVWPVAKPSFTSVDTSLLWTLFVRPSAVHISEVLL